MRNERDTRRGRVEYNFVTVKFSSRTCRPTIKARDGGALTRCGARRTLYTPAIWLISGNVRLNEWTGGDRWGSGTLAEYSKGSVSSTYCTRHVRDMPAASSLSVVSVVVVSVCAVYTAGRMVADHDDDVAAVRDRRLRAYDRSAVRATLPCRSTRATRHVAFVPTADDNSRTATIRT